MLTWFIPICGYKTLIQHKTHQCCAVPQAKLFHSSSAIGLNSFNTQAKFLGNLRAGVSESYQAKGFPLPLAQGFPRTSLS